MKIYLFCAITGVYQGEDFTDPTHAFDRREELPPGATTIVPPPYQRGEVPVFLLEETRWEVRPLVRLEGWQVKTAQEHEKTDRQLLSIEG